MQEIRVRLRLPDDHPLLRFSQNKRSETVRAWLDFGMALADIKKELTNTKELLSAVEKRLTVLETKLDTGDIPSKFETENKREDQVNQVDVNKFLSAFDL
ncbi:MAG: hypothetical protein K6T65_01340 [Peptococcaceae bacterium]|nr:hypothetical protein [Peptococcaceae bacterium]